MASVEIVTIGTEILLGQLIDTNSTHIARTLADGGIDVFAKHSVGDNTARLETMLRGALDRADGVVTTGGLGPTVDDLTKDAVAAAVGTTLAIHEESVRAIAARLAAFGRRGPLTENNRRQAILPVSGIVMPNAHGTAPGFIALRADGKFVACMPGVPSEMRAMLADSLVPWLRERFGVREAIYTRTLHTIGIPESEIDLRIEPLFRALDNPKIAVLAHTAQVDVKIMAKAPDRAAADALIAPVEAELRARIAAGIYGIDEETLAGALVARIAARGATFATAESITGGAIADAIVRVAGASACFRGGVVAYDNAVKVALLDVPQAALDAHGAVSDEVARAMARGACERLDATFGLATTGIAGPTGATASKPVGLVYIALAERGGDVDVRRITFPGTRDEVRRRATMFALNVLWRRLEGDQMAMSRVSMA